MTVNKLGTLYFLIGKMGAGKTTYARQLASESGAVLIPEDEWLSKLYPGEIKDFDDFVDRHRRLQSILKPHIQQLLTAGSSVVLDFPANTVADRRGYLAVADVVGAPHRAMYLNISNEMCLQQIAKRRVEQPDRAQFDTPAMFETVTQYFEKPTAAEGLNLENILRSV